MKLSRTLVNAAALCALGTLCGLMPACGGGGSSTTTPPPPPPTATNYTTCADQQVPNWQSNLFQSNYQAAIKALVNHVSTASYAPQIGYIRVGLGRGGETQIPLNWNDPSSGSCYQSFTVDWQYTVDGTTATSSTWNGYLTSMLQYEGSLSSPKKLMIGLAPMVVGDNSTMDYLAGVAVGQGVAFGMQGLSASDNPASYCDADWCNLFTNLYPTSTPRELQTIGPSCPPGMVCSGQQAQTGPLPPLLTLGTANNANAFEIYAADWEIAYDPNSSNYATSGASYQSALSTAATSASLYVFNADPTDSDLQTYVLPHASGIVLNVDWSDFQPNDANSFDWTITDNSITSWLSAGAKSVNLVLDNTTDGSSTDCSAKQIGSNGSSASGNCAMPQWMWTVLQ